MSSVCVLDTYKQPLDPAHPGRACLLLTQQKAAVFRRFPFTIILKEAKPAPPPAPLRIKIDPGSRTTGLAMINDATGGWSGARLVSSLARPGRDGTARLQGCTPISWLCFIGGW